MKHTLERLNERRQRDGGFTLIELLVVIVIIGILAGVVVFAVGGITDKGEESACEATAKSLETASEAYRAQNTGYAASLDALEPEYVRLDPDIWTAGSNSVTPSAGKTVTYVPTGGGVTENCG
jgi:prepilin-type N-terminal cleavage/methylation domain-containing protein